MKTARVGHSRAFSVTWLFHPAVTLFLFASCLLLNLGQTLGASTKSGKRSSKKAKKSDAGAVEGEGEAAGLQGGRTDVPEDKVVVSFGQSQL